jgi:DNA-binding NarL/FixJ family response regulator
MFLLPEPIRRLFKKRPETEDDFRIFSSDQALVVTVRKLASQQGRSEEEVLTEFAKAGQDLFFNNHTLEESWDALSGREQEVLALVCLGYRNHEVAEMLVISHQTVKSHLQNIFHKFGLRSTKELRSALRNWNFQDWWEARHTGGA